MMEAFFSILVLIVLVSVFIGFIGLLGYAFVSSIIKHAKDGNWCEAGVLTIFLAIMLFLLIFYTYVN